MVRTLLLAAFLMINPTCTEAIGDMSVCYILDGVLILYGIILTVLYCRLRMTPSKKAPASHPEKKPAEGGIYAGLTSHSTDTYETIRMDKKPIV
uniref:Fc receptor, IgE, high affinity I, gamma polypeptide like n=1 Tax=Semicossyphus pulcher TaxID=241346 RepID=UPI0037E7EE55